MEDNKNHETVNLLGAEDVEKASGKIKETFAPSSKMRARKSFGSVSLPSGLILKPILKATYVLLALAILGAGVNGYL